MKETCPNCGTQFQGKVRVRRTLPQNARYWSVLVKEFSKWTGYEESPEHLEVLGQTPKDAAHNVLKHKFLDQIVIPLPDGTEVRVMPSTSSLTIEQFSEYQDRVERYLVLNNIHLPAEGTE